jgi:hypothetical protein
MLPWTFFVSAVVSTEDKASFDGITMSAIAERNLRGARLECIEVCLRETKHNFLPSTKSSFSHPLRKPCPSALPNAKGQGAVGIQIPYKMCLRFAPATKNILTSSACQRCSPGRGKARPYPSRFDLLDLLR